jgi:rare lipoprotein A (peptidoglycan hydrolase)
MKYFFIIILTLFIGVKSSTQSGVNRQIPINDTIIIRLDTLITRMDTLHLGDSTAMDSLKIELKSKKSAKKINGIASFYSKNLDGTKTATGEIYKNSKMTGASNNLKLNTWVRVTNLSNGNTVIVRINDRMHPRMAKKGRVIDLSRAAAAELDFLKKGLTKVQLEVVTAKTVD